MRDKFNAIDLFVYCLVASYALFSAWPSFFGPDDRVFLYIFDDAFYYLKVAMNIAQGYGSTFDGINLTNGYQPLWMLAVLPVYFLIHDRYLALRVVNVYQIVLVALAILVVHRALRKTLRPAPAALAVIPLFWFRFQIVYAGGVEAAILILSLGLTFWYIVVSGVLIDKTPPRRSWLIIGFLFGLVMMARFDYVWYFVAFFVYIAAKNLLDNGVEWSLRIEQTLRSFWTVLPVFAMVIPYLIFNYFVFGHILPISAAMKSSFPFPSSMVGYWNFHPAYFEYSAIAVFSVVFIIIFLLLRRKGALTNSQKELLPSAIWLAAGTALHYASITLFQEWGLYWWYFAGYVITLMVIGGLFFSVLLGFIGSVVLNQRFAFVLLLLPLLLVILASHGYHYWRDYVFGFRKVNEPTYEAAIWMNEHLPRGSIAAMVDAGVAGYFSDVSVINLDGLANSYEYQEWLRQGELSGYLQAMGVGYIIRAYNKDIRDQNYFCFEYSIPSNLYNRDGGFVDLCREDEVFRGRPTVGLHNSMNQLIIWAVRP